jgi:rhodanese-related sulfurtransferase
MKWLSRLLAPLLPAAPEVGAGEDVVFVDVRTPGEYARGHVSGASLIPLSELGVRWKELRDRRNKRVLVYCRTGSRSRVATRMLRAKGFTKVENAGGLGGLRRAGVRIESGRG